MTNSTDTFLLTIMLALVIYGVKVIRNAEKENTKILKHLPKHCYHIDHFEPMQIRGLNQFCGIQPRNKVGQWTKKEIIFYGDLIRDIKRRNK